METENLLTGRISNRKCPACGHHEVGYVTDDGVFHPLKPGITIKIVQGEPAPVDSSAGALATNADSMDTEQADQEELIAWIPDPLKHDKKLRMKYGVHIGTRWIQDPMTGGIYELAFRQKLQFLIEKEIYMPLPVILDRHFNSPHLAAGNSKDIADALFEELDEIKEPVRRMRAWLDDPNEDNLKRLMPAETGEDSSVGSCSDDEFKQELDALTLEDFFDLL
jgi:hypothetical protein